MAEMVENPKGRRLVALVLGIAIILAGLVLVVGGAWLALLGGSFYYLLAGVVLIASGYLIARRNLTGTWIYIGLFLVTIGWALWEAGLDGWALVPRLLGPGILLIVVLIVVSPFGGPREGRKNHARWLAPAGGAALVAGIFLVAGLVGEGHTTGPHPLVPRAAASQAARPTVQGIPVGADWPAFGGTHAAMRYSPLRQINRDTVGRLDRIWSFRTGDLPEEASELPEGETPLEYAPETTPIKIGSTVYLCTPTNQLIAIDAGTGMERWRHDPQVPKDQIATAICRGVSYYRDAGADRLAPCFERIVSITQDARIIAVDARTGRPCPAFGNGGQVDLSTGIGESVPGFYGATSPPTIVRDTIVTSMRVADNQQRDAPSGVIRGYDARTGALRWAWDMAQPGLTGVPPPGRTYTRGTPNSWTIATADEQLGLIYLPMGNASSDYHGADRSAAENEFSSAIVALDAGTGRPAWRFQTVRYDIWDYDLGSQGTLVDIPSPRGPIPALVLPSKTGDLFVLDRRTGRPLHRVAEMRAPIGGVEPANMSRTQPISLFNSVRQPDLRELDMWGISPFDQLFCRIQYRRASYVGYLTPPTHDRHWIQYPSYMGGMDWGGIAIDPVRGLIITNYTDTANHNRLLSRAEVEEAGVKPITQPGGKNDPYVSPMAGSPYGISVNMGWRVPFTGMLCTEPPYGGIRAVDLATGRTVWDRPFGTAVRNGPFGIPSGLPIRIGTPNNGGAVVTAGGITFIGATTDNLFRAIDTETGRVLWQDSLPAGGQAQPITYWHDGHQYVLIMAGGHASMETGVGDELIAYRLTGEGSGRADASGGPAQR